MVVAVVALLLLRPQPSLITRENYNRVQLRMSQSEAEAILGPPGDYYTGETIRSDDCAGEYVDEGLEAQNDIHWGCDHAQIFLTFDSTGAVVIKQFCQQRPVNRGPFGTLRWHFRRWWYKCFPWK